MNDIGLVADGAVLIHNGAIVESGPSRRIENLQQAKSAREIDAAGRVVMPAFVDPDVSLVWTPVSRSQHSHADTELSLSVLSRRRLEVSAAALAASFARLGVLTVGAHTGNAADLRETTKTLLIHRALQNKPLRIRSILAPRPLPAIEALGGRWLPACRKHKLASILELAESSPELLRAAATAAVSAGYSLRIRSVSDAAAELALESGAPAMVGNPNAAHAARLAAIGCVQIVPASEVLQSDAALAAPTRDAIDSGGALALASGSAGRASVAFNPQYVLCLAGSRLGMTPEEAICAVTWNAACSLRMSHVTGSLEPGKYADVAILDVPDYRDLARRVGHSDVQLLLRAGQTVYRRSPVAGLD